MPVFGCVFYQGISIAHFLLAPVSCYTIQWSNSFLFVNGSLRWLIHHHSNFWLILFCSLCDSLWYVKIHHVILPRLGYLSVVSWSNCFLTTKGIPNMSNVAANQCSVCSSWLFNVQAWQKITSGNFENLLTQLFSTLLLQKLTHRYTLILLQISRQCTKAIASCSDFTRYRKKIIKIQRK